MDEITENIYKIPIVRARRLFNNYYSIETDLKSYRCDEFLINLIIDNNIKLEFFPFSSEKFCGLLTTEDDEVTILVNQNLPPYRRNFTIAHELGHFYMHRNINTNFPDKASDLLNSVNDNLEKQANVFASEIVLPTIIIHIMLRSRISFKRIASVTQTSYETLRWRLVRHLRDIYNLSQNQSVKITNDFEDSSIFGYKKSEIHNIIDNVDSHKTNFM